MSRTEPLMRRTYAMSDLVVTASFSETRPARQAIEELIDSSVDPTCIRVLSQGEQNTRVAPVEYHTLVAEGAVIGSTAGAIVGALGLVLGAITFDVLGDPTLAAAGPWLTALHGAAALGAFGGLLGALAGLGFWSEEPDLRADAQEHARILVAVSTPRIESGRIKRIFEHCGAIPILRQSSRDAAPQS
jgi:hypothetical protein